MYPGRMHASAGLEQHFASRAQGFANLEHHLSNEQPAAADAFLFLEALAPLQGPGGPQTTVLLLENITLPGFAATLATLPARVPPNATLPLRGGEAVAPAPQAIVGSERPLGFWRTALPGAQPVVHACRLSSHLQAQLG